MISWFSYWYHFYADDSQIYLAFNPKDPHPALNRVINCVSDVRTWMIDNKLKINDSKTEFLVIAPPRLQKTLSALTLRIGDCKIKQSQKAKNLGVIFDSAMSMELQVNAICQSTNYHLRNVRNVRNLLTQDATEKLIHALITSRLDYCNSLLFGITDNKCHKLQLVQNRAARIVTMTRSSDHITPILHNLHWLPVRHRIMYKIVILTFKVLIGEGTNYLSELVKVYQPGRSLRSSQQTLLVKPKVKLVSYGERSFLYASSKLWNDLPSEMRHCDNVEKFKSLLKTHLFRLAYV